MSITPRKVRRLLAGLVVAGAATVSAQAQGKPAVKPQGAPQPKAAAPAQKDRYAAIRHVKLTDNGRFWAAFGGQVRERVENWNDYNFGALPPGSTLKTDDAFALTRFFASADMHAGTHLRLFALGNDDVFFLVAGGGGPFAFRGELRLLDRLFDDDDGTAAAA